MGDEAELRHKPCAICGKPRVERYRPFCSARCQQVDLGRWFSGTYRVETDEGAETPTTGEADSG